MKEAFTMPDNNNKQDFNLNELKTGDPAYDGKYHPEHYHSTGCSLRVVFVVGGIIEMLGGGVGILIGLVMILIGVLVGVRK